MRTGSARPRSLVTSGGPTSCTVSANGNDRLAFDGIWRHHSGTISQPSRMMEGLDVELLVVGMVLVLSIGLGVTAAASILSLAFLSWPAVADRQL